MTSPIETKTIISYWVQAKVRDEWTTEATFTEGELEKAKHHLLIDRSIMKPRPQRIIRVEVIMNSYLEMEA